MSYLYTTFDSCIGDCYAHHNDHDCADHPGPRAVKIKEKCLGDGMSFAWKTYKNKNKNLCLVGSLDGVDVYVYFLGEANGEYGCVCCCGIKSWRFKKIVCQTSVSNCITEVLFHELTHYVLCVSLVGLLEGFYVYSLGEANGEYGCVCSCGTKSWRFKKIVCQTYVFNCITEVLVHELTRYVLCVPLVGLLDGVGVCLDGFYVYSLGEANGEYGCVCSYGIKSWRFKKIVCQTSVFNCITEVLVHELTHYVLCVSLVGLLEGFYGVCLDGIYVYSLGEVNGEYGCVCSCGIKSWRFKKIVVQTSVFNCITEVLVHELTHYVLCVSLVGLLEGFYVYSLGEVNGEYGCVCSCGTKSWRFKKIVCQTSVFNCITEVCSCGTKSWRFKKIVCQTSVFNCVLFFNLTFFFLFNHSLPPC